MMRKILTALMCLLLALALPLASLAATEYTISAVPGDDLASMEAVKDLLDVLSLRFLCGEQSGMFTLALNGADALNLALRADKDGLYAECAALSDKALFFNKDDVIALISDIMKNSGAQDKVTSAMAQSLEKVFVQIAMQPQDETLSLEEQLTKIEDTFKNDPALADFCTDILGKIQVVEGEYTDPAHDKATSLLEVTINNDDLRKLADSATVQKALTSNSKTTPEEAKAEYLKMFDTMEYAAPVSVYTSEDGIVAFRLPMTMKGTVEVTNTEDGKTTTESKEVDASMDMDYNRLTNGQKVDRQLSVSVKNKTEEKGLATCLVTADETAGQYDLTASMSAEDDGAMKELITMKGALTKDAAGDKGWLGMLSDGTQVTIDYACVHAGEDSDKSLAIYNRGNAVSILELTPADRPLFTLNVKVDRDVTEDALAAVNAATPESSAQILQMTEKEQSEFFTELQTKAMQLGMNILSQLPPSVMSMFTGE